MDEIFKDRINNQFKIFKSKSKKIRKVVLAGSGAVGKTSIVRVLKEKKTLIQFEDADKKYYRTPFMEIETIKTNDMSEMTNPDSGEGNILLCDIAGQMDLPIHALKELSNFVLGGADLIMLVFSNGNTQSFLDLSDWIELIKDYYESKEYPMPAFLLVKNKMDLPESVEEAFVNMMIENEKNIINYIQLSCVNGKNVDHLKEFLVNLFQF